MNPNPDAWSVLTKSVGPAGSPEPSSQQVERLLTMLPDGDKWFQYPPASGRGHAFELRFWVVASDASDAAESGVDLVRVAQTMAGLSGWTIVRVHAASLAEREIELYPGLESRDVAALDWSVMHRALLPDDQAPLDRTERGRILAALGNEDAIAGGSGRLLELRFWTTGRDAVDAAGRAEAAVASALGAVGRHGWTTIRVQTASARERKRELYLGVERRLAEHRGA